MDNFLHTTKGIYQLPVLKFNHFVTYQNVSVVGLSKTRRDSRRPGQVSDACTLIITTARGLYKEHYIT